MTNAEKRLYHQIHPLKLAADISASIVSLYLLWQHRWVGGLVIHIAVPILGSILVMRSANLEPLKKARLGQYVAKHMGALPQAVRLFGDVITVLGAWYQNPLTIVTGLLVVVGAWLNGLWAKE